MSRRVVAFTAAASLMAFVTFSIAAPASAADMTIHVKSPTEGAVVPPTFEVRLRTNTAIGEPDTGRHHIHLYWDGKRDEGEYDIVYKKHFKKKGLEPGAHTLDAVIANADHSTTDAHEIVHVTVSNDAPAAPAAGKAGRPANSGGSSSGNGY
jgi:hypothetical protein